RAGCATRVPASRSLRGTSMRSQSCHPRRVHDGQQLLVDLVDRGGGIHPTQEPLLLIILYERAGLLVEHFESGQHRFGLIVGTLHQRAAALVADPLPLARIMLAVIEI